MDKMFRPENYPVFNHRSAGSRRSYFLVYRDVFLLEMRMTEENGHKTYHKMALFSHEEEIARFVHEAEAENYCEYRNHMVERYGTDDVDAILDYNP